MILRIIISIIDPALFALSNIVDKFLVHGDDDGSEPGSVIAITGFFSLVVAIPLGAWIYFTHESIGLEVFLPLAVNSVTWMAAIWLYLEALRKDAVSRVVPWFQIIPIFCMLFGSTVLHDVLKWQSIWATVAIIGGGLILSVKDNRIKLRTVALMLPSSLLVAIHSTVFAKFGRGEVDISAIFSDIVGMAFWGLLLLVSKRWRVGFVLGLRNKWRLQATAEVLTILALVFTAYAKLHAPIAVVEAGLSTQPLFILGFAFIFVRLFPKVFQKESEGSTWMKLVGIALTTVGGIILAIYI